jgi:N-acetylmuramoyl-L-alanine amidase/putative methionine-R-sulfoxide reductase with GAF domain
MATTPTKPDIDVTTPFSGVSTPVWPRGVNPSDAAADLARQDLPNHEALEADDLPSKPSQLNALQALLAFSALHDQLRRRKSLAARHAGFDAGAPVAEFDKDEQFVLDEVLQLVAERAVAITGADGLAIALAENNEIVLRAAAGTVRPDVGARIDRDSAFSGACFQQAQTVMCDDTETDPRVNLQACRRLGARSMIAVPLCGRRRVIGLLEAFSSWPFGFNDSDVRNLSLLAELVLGALKPEDEDRFAESAEAAAANLEAAAAVAQSHLAISPQQAAPLEVVLPVEAPVPSSLSIALPETKSEKAEVAAAIPVAPVLDEPAIARVADLETPVALETSADSAIAPEIAIAETETPRRRPGVLVLALCAVVVALFVAGVLFKWKTAQLGGLMVRTEKPAPKAAVTPPLTTASPVPAPDTANSLVTNPDAISDTAEPENSPATPQELTKFPRVTGIRHWSSADSSTVVLDLEDQVQYEAHRLASPDRIYFDLRDTQLGADLAGKAIDVNDALLNRVRVAQPVAGMTRIVLETRANSNFSVSLEPNPYRLVVEVRKIGVTAKGAVNLFPNSGEAERNKLAIVIPPPTREDLQLRAHVPRMRIVVDAGHGGWDLGTVGRRGLLEKDLVLEIAERLGKLLESRLGMDVIYTRHDDNYIPLDERASIANQAQADLFVSVHANYSDLPSARGVETYYTNFFTAPGSKEAGSKDVDAKLSGVKGIATPTLTGADLHEKIEQSRRLAASVQRSLYGTLSAQNPGLRDRGVKEAGFVVLTESAMPGILAEVSFVSSPTDEQKLRSDGYREQIAEALYKGIARYAASPHSVKLAAK